MADKWHQRKSEQRPVDFNFSPAFIEGDNIVSVSITVPANVSEVSAKRVVSGQTVQCRFNTASATAGTTYAVSVKATSSGGDVAIIDLDLVVLAD